MDEDAWLSGAVLPDFGPQIGYDDVAVAYFRDLYAERGALTGEELWAAAVTHQLEVARRAVDVVAADVAAAEPDRDANIEAIVEGFVVRIRVNGRLSSHDGGRMLAFGPAPAIVEVATTVQDLLTDEWWTVWPPCPEHGRGLLAEPGPPPQWACRIGPHIVGPIGALPASRAQAEGA